MWTRRRWYQAPVAATDIAVVRNAPSSMCSQRIRNTGPQMIASQSLGMILPSTISWPTGTCIQLLLARIQNDDAMVPSATMQQENR